MPKLSEKGVVHFLLPLLLIAGIIVTVWLVTNGNPLKLFSRASNPPIVFKNSTGASLPTNSLGVPQSTSATVKVELTSPLGGPGSGGPSSPVSSPTQTGTVAYRIAENPTALNSASYIPYTQHPTVLTYTFTNYSLGQKFLWVDFKGSNGTVERKSAELDIVAPSTSGPISPPPTPSPTPFTCNACAADINKNGRVDIVDYSYLLLCYNKKASDVVNGKPCAPADINGDGKIGGSDFSCLVSQFGKRCAQSTPTPIPTPSCQVSLQSIGIRQISECTRIGSGWGKTAEYVCSDGKRGTVTSPICTTPGDLRDRATRACTQRSCKADLIMTSGSLNVYNNRIGSKPTVYASILNDGTITSPANTLSITITKPNGASFCSLSLQVPAINKGGYSSLQSVNCPSLTTKGNYRVTATVDAYGVVPEIDESNNTVNTTFNVSY